MNKSKLFSILCVVLVFFLYKNNDNAKNDGLKFDGTKGYVIGADYLDTLSDGTIEIQFKFYGSGMRTLFSASSSQNLVNNFSINIVDNKIQY